MQYGQKELMEVLNIGILLSKEKGSYVGAVSLREMHPNMKINIWQTYKVYPITEKTVLFKRKDNEFCTVDGKYEHEMGTIKIEYINNIWLNINVNEKKQ